MYVAGPCDHRLHVNHKIVDHVKKLKIPNPKQRPPPPLSSLSLSLSHTRTHTKMEYWRPLKITNLSAEDLKDVQLVFKMKVYVAVSVIGDPFIDPKEEYLRTSADSEGETNPSWDTHLNFIFHEPSLQNNNLTISLPLSTAIDHSAMDTLAKFVSLSRTSFTEKPTLMVHSLLLSGHQAFWKKTRFFSSFQQFNPPQLPSSLLLQPAEAK
ncbi:hypothetical protein L1049_004450 [Liquidambar formosana]|uniref:C2 domain-containing protein n=1 Tax=Liquidambar formosana TaxID=63359 RepID=A0AAP0RN82_LIQFO